MRRPWAFPPTSGTTPALFRFTLTVIPLSFAMARDGERVAQDASDAPLPCPALSLKLLAMPNATLRSGKHAHGMLHASSAESFDIGLRLLGRPSRSRFHGVQLGYSSCTGTRTARLGSTELLAEQDRLSRVSWERTGRRIHARHTKTTVRSIGVMRLHWRASLRMRVRRKTLRYERLPIARIFCVGQIVIVPR